MAAAYGDLKAVQEVMETESEEAEPKKDGGITKMETDQVAPSSLEEQIIRQVEYYFGDINLPSDTFLQNQLKLNGGWIPLEVMLKFNRLSSLSTDADVIVTALANASATFMEISEDKKQIRRSPDRALPDLNEERRKELMSRTVYVKGFPDIGTTLDILVEFFAEYGPIDNIKKRHFLNKINKTYSFRGSVFVTFETREKAEVFLNAGAIKYQDIELLKKWQSVYVDEKRKEWKETKHKQKEEKRNKGKVEIELRKGAIIHLTGFNSTTSRDDIRRQLTAFGADVAYIQYIIGMTEARVRLHGENSNIAILDKIKETQFLVNGCEITGQAVYGDEEGEFLQKAKATMQKRRHMKDRAKKSRRKRNRERKGKGCKGGDRKRKGSPSGDEPPAKQVEMEQEYWF